MAFLLPSMTLTCLRMLYLRIISINNITRCATKVFHMPLIRRYQPNGVERMIFDKKKLTASSWYSFARVGALTMYLTAVSMGGVALIIIPLMLLTANQLE